MGTLSRLHRVSREVFGKLYSEAKFLDWLEGDLVDQTTANTLAKLLGYPNGQMPVHCSLDKSWSGILQLLAETSKTKAYNVLYKTVVIQNGRHGSAFFHYFDMTPQYCVLQLRRVKSENLRRIALKRNLDLDYDLAYTLAYFDILKDFFTEAAAVHEVVLITWS